MTDTIFALSSAPGKAGVSVVRVSGPKAWDSLSSLITSPSPAPRQAALKRLIHPVSGQTLDHALVIGFKAPSSFTGEDCVEYHLHGSTAVVEAMLAILGKQVGHRLAEPGEFTRRSFENGKCDLTEAEAVADLINAETEAQRLQALSQMEGGLSTLYHGWRGELVKALAYVEAVIDFPDEDVPDSETQKAFPAIEKIIGEIADHLNDNHRGERLRSGIQVAIIGAPNAGKSSLINALARREVAIVSPTAGTTRDVIEAHLDLAGYPVIVADTAGLRSGDLDQDAHGAIEGEGIRRAITRAQEADICVLVFDGTKPLDDNTLSYKNEDSMIVYNKSDEPEFSAHQDGIALSVLKNDNLDRFIAALTEKIKTLYASSQNAPTLTRARHRAALEDCHQRLIQSLQAALPELMAEDLRMATRALGRITGRVDVEDLLDVIFRDFCIGK
jgi:tRNA modification GTPase